MNYLEDLELVDEAEYFVQDDIKEILKWYLENTNDIQYMQKYIDEFGCADAYHILSGGQIMYHYDKLIKAKDKLEMFIENLDYDYLE